MKKVRLIPLLFCVCSLASAEFHFDRYVVCHDTYNNVGILRDKLEGCVLSMTEWQVASRFHYQVLVGKQFKWESAAIAQLDHKRLNIVSVDAKPICLTRLRPKKPIYYIGLGRFYERNGEMFFNCRGINVFNPKVRYGEPSLLNGEEKVSKHMATKVLVAKQGYEWLDQSYAAKGFAIKK